MLINAHTHTIEQLPDAQRIYNFMIPNDEATLEAEEIELPKGWLSVGIHPWYINEPLLDLQLHWLRRIAKHDSVKFIGETGLDRLKGADLALQEMVFRKHISLANELGKPLIIHCVRCFSELISIKKVLRPQVPMIVHGFNQNLQIAEQLLSKGFYFSFGTALLTDNSNAQQSLLLVPNDRFLVETDEATISITAIYEAAAQITKMSASEIEKQIEENYLSIVIPK